MFLKKCGKRNFTTCLYDIFRTFPQIRKTSFSTKISKASFLSQTDRPKKYAKNREIGFPHSANIFIPTFPHNITNSQQLDIPCKIRKIRHFPQFQKALTQLLLFNLSIISFILSSLRDIQKSKKYRKEPL